MQPLPHWYRWTLIVIATLILCACRAPFQDAGSLSIPVAMPETESPGAEQGESVVPSLPLATKDASLPLLTQPVTLPVDPSAIESVPELPLTLLATEDEAAPEDMVADVEPTLELNGPQQVAEPVADPAGGNVSDLVAEVDEPADADAIEQTLPLGEAKPAVRKAVALEESQDAEDLVRPATAITAATSSSVSAGQAATSTTPMSVAPAVAHFDTNCPPAMAPGCVAPQCIVPYEHGKQMMQFYPDEYLCDGGDALSSVVRGRDGDLLGLDPEDTVAIYDLASGEAVVEPSNRVCIYAPRFAAVRQVTSLYQNAQHNQAILAQRDLPPLTEVGRLAPDNVEQRVAPVRHLIVQPAASFKARTLGVEASQGTALAELIKDLSAHENLRVMRVGVHKQSEKARLAEYSTRAVSWAHDQAVQVILDEVVAETAVSRQGAAQIHAIGGGKAKLRIIKTASVDDALPGEEVEFTLRFDNVGFQPITNVTIVDNLTTRLEYVDGSQLCSFDAVFEERANQVESLRLSWKIVETINPGKGGLIRFRCRVR